MGWGGPAFEAAANAPALVDAFDTLVGPGRWVRRSGMGSFPLRFPHERETNDAGWHIESGYLAPDGSQYLTNYRSRSRALLLLFLFSEVTPEDAPTRIRVGSHHRTKPRFMAQPGMERATDDHDLRYPVDRLIQEALQARG